MNPTASPPAGHGGIFPSAFRPAWWLPGPHLQTCWPTLIRRPPRLATVPEEVDLPDGDVLGLTWTERPGTDTTGPLVAILHGLEGSAESSYAAGLLAVVARRGWTGVVLRFRGSARSPNRLARGYHAGETGDAAWFLGELSRRYPGVPLAAVGFSLGGNVLLKLLGEAGASTPVQAAVAVSPPLDLAACAARLEQGLSRVYQHYLVTKLKASLRAKETVVPLNGRLRLPPTGLAGLRTLRQYDDAVTAPLHGFSGVDEYYARSAAMPFLKQIKTPTLVLQSTDDPFMGPEVLPGPGDLSPWVRSEPSPRGGHVGFLAGNRPFRPRYWLEKRILEYLVPILGETHEDHFSPLPGDPAVVW